MATVNKKKNTRHKRPVKRAPLQYSKKLSTAVTLFWIIYRLAELVAAVIEPSIAESLVHLVQGVDTVMMVNLGFYSGNSVAEKAILAWMNKGASNDDDDDDSGKKDDVG